MQVDDRKHVLSMHGLKLTHVYLLNKEDNIDETHTKMMYILSDDKHIFGDTQCHRQGGGQQGQFATGPQSKGAVTGILVLDKLVRGPKFLLKKNGPPDHIFQ